ncbi:hypothetical protein [Mycolicibacterium thermoresistibile]|uniref:PE-PGRS family protein n=1 Tax=Mycolicibacterium thermoresistibile TaxID=1797 RepID=A0A124E7Q8_MYCTH|nr:hypothetical protein [Mycolicibacterium thermoresistibile]MCV7188264.1 hypothetical protein [Mycolicibacterium thermoresistibile]GAT13344.1 putative uncharacterized protein [Mycolicibacterium thermoresistibile]SNW18481.1 Uncharacterised protein [Mycolicibacterium thermoresistibile]
MHARLRPYLTAGVALAGASVIAVAPAIAPLPPDIKVHAAPTAVAPVDLAAESNPLVALTQLFQNTTGNVGGLVNQILADPAPILEQLVANQIANVEYLRTLASTIGELLPDLIEGVRTSLGMFVEQIQAGNFIGAGQTLGQILVFAGLPLLGVISAPLGLLQNSTQNLANAAAQLPNVVGSVLFPTLLPIMGTINATFDAAQSISDAFGEGDFLTALGVALSTPIIVKDALLNGFAGGPGLLTADGPLSALIAARNLIARALTPIPPTGPDPVPPPMTLGAGASVVSLSVDAADHSLEAASSPLADKDSKDAKAPVESGDVAATTVTASITAADDTGGNGDGRTEAEKADADGTDTDSSDRAESLVTETGLEGADGVTGGTGDTVNGATNLSDGNKAGPSTAALTAADSSSNNKLGATKPRPGVKKAGANASAASSSDSGDE